MGGPGGGDAPGRLDAVDPGAQLEVHEDDVGSEPGGQGDGLLAAARLAHDLDVGFAAEEGEQSGPYDSVVVAEQDAYGRGHAGPSGVMRVPPGSTGLTGPAGLTGRVGLTGPTRCRCAAGVRRRRGPCLRRAPTRR